MPNQGGIQLIPETKHSIKIRRPGENKYLFIGVFIFLILGGAGFFMSSYKRSIESNIAEIELNIQNLETERDKNAEAELKVINSQMLAVNDLLINHIIWSKGLATFENLIKPEVQIISFSSGVVDGVVTIRSKARSYTVVARQIASFLKEPTILDVAVASIKSDTGGLEFDMTIKFDAKKFNKNTDG